MSYPRSFLVLLAFAPAYFAQGLLDTPQRILRPRQGEMQYLADVDGDGDDDVVWFRGVPGTPTRWEGFQVLFNAGDGDLSAAGPFVFFPNGSNRFDSLLLVGVPRAGDVTGDGRVDVLVRERLSSFQEVNLLVYPGTDASGSFGAPLALPMTGGIGGVTLGNVDADATLEIAVLERVSGAIEAAWYDWNGAGFTKSATLGTATPSSIEGTRMTALDVDDDGDDDLVYGLAFSDKVRLLHSVGGAPSTMTPFAFTVPSGTSLFPYVCDLAGGGAEDVLVVAAEFSNASFRLIPLTSEGGTLVPGTLQHFTGDSGIVYGQGFRVGDWDGDGDADVASAGWQEPGGTTEGIVAFFENDGANGFGAGPVARVETTDVGLAPVGMTDLDGDGRMDLVGGGNVVFGRARFESLLVNVTDPFFGLTPRTLFDCDGDGDLDFYFASGSPFDTSSVYLNDGSAAFPEHVHLPPAPPGLLRLGIAGIADFDGDGRADFLASLWTPPISAQAVFQEMRLYAGDGLGGFVDAGHAGGELIFAADQPLDPAYDLDGDGDMDLVARLQERGGYWPNAGHGTFAHFEALFRGTNGATPVAVGDLDGDGDADVITVALLDEGVYAWRNNADHHVRRVDGSGLRFHPSQVSTHRADPRSVTLADADLDGDLDVAFTSDNGIHLYENDGAGSFDRLDVLDPTFANTGEPLPTHLVFEDLDGDGDLDLLAGAEPAANTPRLAIVFQSRGDGTFDDARAYAGGVVGCAGDLDGDGDVDLAGRAVVRSTRFDGPADGRIHQYGAGTAGSGGLVPLLGAAGPLRPGSTQAALRVRRGIGGGRFALFSSHSAGTGPAVPFPGSPTLLGEPFFTDIHFAGGTPGQPGAGAFELDLGPELVSLVGLTFFFQVGFTDPAGADGFALSNGLELTFGH